MGNRCFRRPSRYEAPVSEQHEPRNLADILDIEKIKELRKNGYRISRDEVWEESHGVHHEKILSQSTELAWLRSKEPIALEELEKCFKNRGARWVGKSEMFRLVAIRLRKQAQSLLALDVLRAGLEENCRDDELTLLLAQTLAQLGTTAEAIRLLQKLKETKQDSETYGALARCYKDLAERATSEALTRKFTRKAYKVYEASFHSGGRRVYYVGINSATMSFLLGRLTRARAVAREVLALCHDEEKQSEEPSYWLMATLGEAYMILGQVGDARRYYAAAVALAPSDYGRLISTRKQLKRLIATYDRYSTAASAAHAFYAPVAAPRRSSSVRLDEAGQVSTAGGQVVPTNAAAAAAAAAAAPAAGTVAPGRRAKKPKSQRGTVSVPVSPRAGRRARYFRTDGDDTVAGGSSAAADGSGEQTAAGEGIAGDGVICVAGASVPPITGLALPNSVLSKVQRLRQRTLSPAVHPSAAAAGPSAAAAAPGDGCDSTLAVTEEDPSASRHGKRRPRRRRTRRRLMSVAVVNSSHLRALAGVSLNGNVSSDEDESACAPPEIVKPPQGYRQLDAIFGIPPVVYFSTAPGFHHAIDLTGQGEMQLVERLHSEIAAAGPAFAYARLSSIQELLFFEAVLSAGGTVCVVLALPRRRFLLDLRAQLVTMERRHKEEARAAAAARLARLRAQNGIPGLTRSDSGSGSGSGLRSRGSSNASATPNGAHTGMDKRGSGGGGEGAASPPAPAAAAAAAAAGRPSAIRGGAFAAATAGRGGRPKLVRSRSEGFISVTRWLERVEAVLDSASKVIVANDVAVGFSVTNDQYAGYYGYGLALRRAADIAGSLLLLHCSVSVPQKPQLHLPPSVGMAAVAASPTLSSGGSKLRHRDSGGSDGGGGSGRSSRSMSYSADRSSLAARSRSTSRQRFRLKSMMSQVPSPSPSPSPSSPLSMQQQQQQPASGAKKDFSGSPRGSDTITGAPFHSDLDDNGAVGGGVDPHDWVLGQWLTQGKPFTEMVLVLDPSRPHADTGLLPSRPGQPCIVGEPTLAAAAAAANAAYEADPFAVSAAEQSPLRGGRDSGGVVSVAAAAAAAAAAGCARVTPTPSNSGGGDGSDGGGGGGDSHVSRTPFLSSLPPASTTTRLPPLMSDRSSQHTDHTTPTATARLSAASSPRSSPQATSAAASPTHPALAASPTLSGFAPSPGLTPALPSGRGRRFSLGRLPLGADTLAAAAALYASPQPLSGTTDDDLDSLLSQLAATAGTTTATATTATATATTATATATSVVASALTSAAAPTHGTQQQPPHQQHHSRMLSFLSSSSRLGSLPPLTVPAAAAAAVLVPPPSFPVHQPLPPGSPPRRDIVAMPSLRPPKAAADLQGGGAGSVTPGTAGASSGVMGGTPGSGDSMSVVEEGEFAMAYVSAKRVKQVVKGIVFADVTGYSKLGEGAVVNFVSNVIAGVDSLIGELRRDRRPAVRNTWGDAFYFVFNRVRDAGTFALTLSDFITQTDWEAQCGLPNSLNIRVSLHAAPLFPVWDAVIGALNYTGCHTSRAARIEPVTPPGSVYCSQAFAALSATLGVTDYDCTYVGHMPLAKKYGEQPVFYVFWAAPKLVTEEAAAAVASGHTPSPSPPLSARSPR